MQRFQLKNVLGPIAAVSIVCLALACCECVVAATNAPAVGSQNVAVADPPIPRPATTSCSVQLFPRENFGPVGENTRMDAIPHPFTYRPPAQCKGPWAKVVLEADFSVDAGHQYDRTASIWLNGVNLYFGTTEEPSPKFGPNWQVSRDLTDYSALLRSPGQGVALVNNWVDSRRKSVIHASAKLLFYPSDSQFPAPITPDAVYPLNTPGSVPANLQTGQQALTRKITFPRNTARVYLDVIAQSQFHDEFWYTCLPDNYIQRTTSFAMRRGYKGAPKHPRACSGGSYREVEVSVDGQPAGLAPISPWVYTGGIDPFLWRPTPGVETLNFVPYRLDLTPFAGLLSDGSPHSISVRVLGANQYFSVAAVLLVYRDAKTAKTGGSVTHNTLSGLSLLPSVLGGFNVNRPGVNGDVWTKAKQSYVIEGYINTPGGRVRSRVEESIRFNNTQHFTTENSGARSHVIQQVSHVETASSSTGGISGATSAHRAFDYSLTVNELRGTEPGGLRTRSVKLQQDFDKHIEQTQHGLPAYHASISNHRSTADQLSFNPAHRGSFGNHGQTSTQIYSYSDSLGDCYHAALKAEGGKVASFTTGQGCNAAPVKMKWFAHPDGSPDSFGWRGKAARELNVSAY